MFIPLRTNRPAKRRPIVTETLILANLLIYLAGLVAEFGGAFPREALVNFGHLGREDFHAWQLVTYQFLHAPHDVFHVAFNMLFLWVFGCGVEDRLGRTSYLCFYLIGGAVAGAAHMIVSRNPVIGASGSVAAVTGAFLALFPRSRIQVLVFFFIIGVFSIPALWFIGFYFVMDLLRQTGMALFGTSGGVAYMAHIAGYVYGFALSFTLLGLGIVKREEFDVFYLFKQSRRRAAFRAAGRGQTGGLWESASADTGRQLEKKAKRVKGKIKEAPRHAAERSEIIRLVMEHALPAAAARYRELLAAAPDTAFSEQVQLDLANQLQSEQDHENAAAAYELLIRHYPRGSKSAEVRLILGVIYARRLARPDRAKELIEAAIPKLHDANQKALADQLLAELGGAA